MNKELLKELAKTIKKKIEQVDQRWLITKQDERLEELNTIIQDEHFWQHPDQITYLKEQKKLERISNNIKEAKYNNQSIIEILETDSMDDSIEEVAALIKQEEQSVQNLSIALLLHKEQDKKNCYLDINAGAGGTEAQDWAAMLLRMYIRFCEKAGFRYQLIDELQGEEAGIKSSTLFIEGENAHGILESENGIHRLVRISPFDANKKRHTSFAAVSITPEAEEVEITIDAKDLRIDTYRAGGAGGQHVNKTDSAVRITHFPSGIVVQCQNERSQLQNKEQAMKMLRSKLYKKQLEEKREQFDAIERKKIEWGSQIRSYVLHPYKMVKDHRTEIESFQPEETLDGDIMPFIETYLIQRN
jgi:peptide chain release factor 2